MPTSDSLSLSPAPLQRMADVSLRCPPPSLFSLPHHTTNAAVPTRHILLHDPTRPPHRSIKAVSSPTPAAALTQDDLQKLAADKAVEYVRSGMVLSLRTGSTAAFVVAKLCLLVLCLCLRFGVDEEGRIERRGV